MDWWQSHVPMSLCAEADWLTIRLPGRHSRWGDGVANVDPNCAAR